MDHKAESTSLLEFLFDRAMEMPAPERAVFLDRECPDAALRARVESLLKSHDDASGFLDTSDRTSLWPLAEDRVGSSLVGHMLKQYHVTRRIGVGGMGVVYEAEQSSPKRRVALKVLRQGRLSRSASRRIAVEAEALGRLNHPGIAQIIEAGAADIGEGPQPFFAMELVEGDTLLEYVKNKNPSRRDRLKLFVRTCEAVHHAHMKGVIHRDLKPGNILVVERAGPADVGESEPQPKVLDFGVARATDSDIQHTTMQSDSGAIIGTVAYMSPEQIRGEMKLVDARSDVYALGVVLFEMLAGRLPFDVRSRPIPEAMRMISEEDPASLASIDRMLQGDLETITRTAMEKNPARRYDSAAALAEDVRRHLRHEPIAARAPSVIYRLCKFVRRRRAISAAILIVSISLIAALVVINSERLEAIEARREAERQYDEAMRMSNFFLKDVVTRLERAPGTVEIRRDLLGEILRQTHSQLASRPDDVRLLESHALALQAMATLLSYDREQDEEAFELISDSLEILRTLARLSPDDPWRQMRISIALVLRAQIGERSGHIDDRRPHYLEALAIDEELHRRHPDERRFHDNLFWGEFRIAQRAINAGLDETEAWINRAMKTAEKLREAHPDHYLTIYSDSNVHYLTARLQYSRGDLESARMCADQAMSLQRRLLEMYPNSRQFMIHAARVKRLDGELSQKLGDLERAETSFHSSLSLIEQLLPFEQEDLTVRSLRNSLTRLLADLDEARSADTTPQAP